MKKLLSFVLALYVGTVINVAVANDDMQYFFTQLDTRSGLSENNVKSILQDHWGFMWFGTKNGLNRYDGSGIKHYNVDDLKKKCGNHNVSALFEDKSNRIWVGTDRGVYIFNPYNETFSLFDAKAVDGCKITNWIAQITMDRQGCIWIISPDEGAFRFNPKTSRMVRYHTSPKKGSYEFNPQCVCVRKNGDVWLGTNGAGLYYLNPNTGKLKHFITDKSGHSLAGTNIYTMCDYGNWIVVGEHEGMLMKYNPTTNELLTVNAPDVHYKIIRTLHYDGKNLFVGTQDGLFVIREKTGMVTHVVENNMQPYGLSDNMIYSIYEDRNHGIWLGTMYSGVNYMPRNGMIFNNYVPLQNGNSLSGRCIREIQCDRYGNVWIASEEGTLDVYNPWKHSFSTVHVPFYKGGNNRLALMVEGDYVWAGVFKNGIDVINTKTHALTHYTPQQLNLKTEGSVYALYKDSKGRIWLGSGNGVYVKSEGMKFAKISNIPDFFIQDIKEDRRGNIWIATMGNGVLRYNPSSGRYVNYTMERDAQSISSNSVSSMTFDHNGNLWFSTDRGGICMFNMRTNKFISYSIKDGLPDDVAYKILEDAGHCLWFGTNQGLVRFDPRTKNITVYKNTNGLIGNQYSYKSAVQLGNNKFLFGGVDGLVEFQPKLAAMGNKNRKVFITNIRINNNEIRPGDDGILNTNILYTNEIKLPHDKSNISFDISVLNYSGTESDTYEYMLKGVDDNWIKTQNVRNISYSQLQPGHYTLMVRLAGNSSGITELGIVVMQPWWWSLFAKIIYLLIICYIVYYTYNAQQRLQIRRLALREQQFREAKDKEVMRSKISFFTDITHEIRTPLTLISGSVENINDENIENPKISKNLNAIAKNCKRLLNLINQLLDFRKMDSNSMKLNFTNEDICQKLRDIIDRFEPTVTRMHKTISLDMEDDSFVMPVDSEAFTKIISNLLNNASKYSESFIQVQVRHADDDIEISVINDGDKIPADKVEDIFQPFVQLDNSHNVTGSGIGLPLARSLAELHRGSLVFDSFSEYNKFVLLLPLKQENMITLDESLPMPEDVSETVSENILIDDYDFHGVKDFEYTVLVVEDNPEVLQMIADKLHDHYNVIMAQNGEEALHKIKSQHIDIVISDIMMPVMDGLQFTSAVKNDIEINHIPIILLTAKQTMQSHLEGLKSGADAYIEKPFTFIHLLTQVETLLSNRRRERESFLHKPYLPVQNTGIDKAAEEFLSQISNLIIEHIKQPEFNVEQLANAMCMSRSSLHRKIKEVSDLTPIDFIRLIRLKKAAELIKEKGFRTQEVCEMVGISSPSYFIKLFHRQFGMTPKDFANKKKE